MIRSKNLISSYIISIAFCIIVYLLINDILFSILLGIIMFILLNFYTFKKINKANKFLNSLANFSHFANSLIMQLTVMPNTSTALIDISEFLDKEQKDVVTNEELLVNERLDLLDKYYEFPLYQVFKEIIILYDTQGGNIIDMSMQLLNQIDIYIKNVETIKLDNYKKIGEVMFLWAFSIFALIYIKSILIDYYLVVIENITFKFIIILFFLFFIFSSYIISKKYIEITLGD